MSSNLLHAVIPEFKGKVEQIDKFLFQVHTSRYLKKTIACNWLQGDWEVIYLQTYQRPSAPLLFCLPSLQDMEKANTWWAS